MPNLTKDDRFLERELLRYVNESPIMVSRYVLYAGDGYSTGNSWQFLDSFRASEQGLPRTTWFPVSTDGVATKHLSQLFVPVSSVGNVAPAVGQRIILYTLGGTVLHTQYDIHYVQALRGTEVYGYHLVIETIQ